MYLFKTLFYQFILTMFFSVIVGAVLGGIFIGILLIININLGIFLYPRSIAGLGISSLIFGYWIAKYFLEDRWNEIGWKSEEKNYLQKNKEYIKETKKERKDYQKKLNKIADKYVITRKNDK